MSLRSMFVAVVCGLVFAASTGTAGGAIPVAVFTVYGPQTSEQLVVDRNGNGQPDPGDVLSVAGTLTDVSGNVIGTWSAAVAFADQDTANVSATFRFTGRGGLFAQGSFNPSVGAPPDLQVFAGFGAFRSAVGTLLVGEAGVAVNSFTFTLRRGPVWHP